MPPLLGSGTPALFGRPVMFCKKGRLLVLKLLALKLRVRSLGTSVTAATQSDIASNVAAVAARLAIQQTVTTSTTRPMLRKGIVADDDGGDVGGGADDAAVQGRDALAPWPTH